MGRLGADSCGSFGGRLALVVRGHTRMGHLEADSRGSEELCIE